MKKYVTESQHEHVMKMLSRRIDDLEKYRYAKLNERWQDRAELRGWMVAILVEAGLLVEDAESSKVVKWEDKTYKVKKVK